MKVNIENLLRIVGNEIGNHYQYAMTAFAQDLKTMRDRVRAGDPKAFEEFFATYVFMNEQAQQGPSDLRRAEGFFDPQDQDINSLRAVLLAIKSKADICLNLIDTNNKEG